jgi:hypothetical protein
VSPFTGLDGSLQCSPEPDRLTLVYPDVGHIKNSQSRTQSRAIGYQIYNMSNFYFYKTFQGFKKK